jgi:hypothetical protein
MSTNLAAVARPSSLGVDLDHMLHSRFLPARPASRTWLAAELPVRLENCVSKLSLDAEWRAYTDGSRIFFAVAQRPARRAARMADRHGLDDTGASMDVYFLDSNAAVYSAGKWCYGPEQGWWLDAVLPLSYDAEHGWWLEAVMAAPRRVTCRTAAF